MLKVRLMVRHGRSLLIGAACGTVLCMLVGADNPTAHAAPQSAFDAATVQREWDGLPETPTEEFLIKTNLPERSKAALVEQADELLGETEEAVQRVLDLSRRGPHKFRLSVFATMDEYQAYVSAIMTPSLRESYIQHSGGFFSSMRNEIVVPCRPEGCLGTLVHEFTHALAGRTFFMAGGERVNWTVVMPPWLNEGLAEYVSSRVASEGALPWDALNTALKNDTLISLADLVNTESRPLEHPFFYPAAWSLVMFLIDHDPSGSPERMRRYLQVLKTRRFATDQFVTVFGTLEDLEPRWKRFIASRGNRKSTR